MGTGLAWKQSAKNEQDAVRAIEKMFSSHPENDAAGATQQPKV